MDGRRFILRCYARPEGDHLLAICVDLDIAVVGNSIQEVRDKMTDALTSYFESINKDNAQYLLGRPAPLHVFLDYYRVYMIVMSSYFFANCKKNFQIFCENLIPGNISISPSGCGV